MRSSDHHKFTIAAALQLCRVGAPAIADDLEELLGEPLDEPDTQDDFLDPDWLMNALRLFVLVALDVDDTRLGSVLSCIRYLTVQIRATAPGKLTIH